MLRSGIITLTVGSESLLQLSGPLNQHKEDQSPTCVQLRRKKRDGKLSVTIQDVLIMG